MKKITIFTFSHSLFLIIGFAVGIYLLPILTAPSAPDKSYIIKNSNQAIYKTKFNKNLNGSDLLHNGEGDVFLNKNQISFIGKITPGPDYRLYLTKKFVENEKDFLAIKMKSLYVGDVKTFKNFSLMSKVELPLEKYNSIIIWCESFSEFITSAKYK